MHTDLFIDSQAERLLFYAMLPTLAGKKKKEGSTILASMLWSQNTDPFILFVFTCVFICSCNKSQSFKPWPRVCVPVQKKGRFVVVLPSHLRCSPFKRHRLSYKLCDCELVGGGLWDGRVPTVPPCSSPPPVLPLRPANTSCQPFCEHVLQHSCCSTFLWQRLFFLTSTQKLPSAQDSSFAFHRPGRRSAGVEGLEGGEGEREKYTNTCRNRHGTRAMWLFRKSFRWQEEGWFFFFFWSNHRWCSSRRKWLQSSGVIGSMSAETEDRFDRNNKNRERERSHN